MNMIISFVTPKDTQFQLDFSFAKTNVTDGHKDSKEIKKKKREKICSGVTV